MKETQVEEQILNAAKKLFIKKGKSAARMQEIADEAGVNKALLHYYFRNKNKLFDRVYDDTIKDLMNSVILLSLKGDSFKEILRSLIDKHFEFLKNNQKILQFFLWEATHDEEVVKKHTDRVRESLGFHPFKLFIKKIEEAKKNGEIKEINSEEFIMNFLSLDLFYFASLPVISSMLNLDEGQVHTMTKNRKREIFRLLWNDVKAEDK